MFEARAVAFDDPSLVTRLKSAGLPRSDLGTADQLFFAFTTASQHVGCGGFLIANDHALLRSVVVDEDQRGTGLGAAIVEALLDEAAAQGAKAAWLLTTDAQPFFARVGFHLSPRSDAPHEISSTPQFSSICPGSAALMRRDLTKRGAPNVAL